MLPRGARQAEEAARAAAAAVPPKHPWCAFSLVLLPPKTKTLKQTTKTKRNESNQARAVAFTKTRFVSPFLLDHLHSMLPRGRKRALWRKLQREPEPEPEPEVPLVADGVWLETVTHKMSCILLPWLGIASHSLSAFWKRDFETERYPDRLRATGWI